MIASLILAISLVLSIPSLQGSDLTPGYWERSPLPQTGVATHYAQGVMEYVVQYRLDRGEISACPECVGTVAMLRAGDIGRRVWLVPPGGEMVGPFLVVDCARRTDIDDLLARGWVVDLSYSLGQTWGLYRPMDGYTVLADPSDMGAPSVVAAPTRYYINPSEVVISRPSPTPAFEPPTPTPWATRKPEPLTTTAPSTGEVPTTQGRAPTAGSVFPPVVTTPTPERADTAALPAPSTPEVTGVLAAATQVPLPAGDLAVGRAGEDLLQNPLFRAVTAASMGSTAVTATPTATRYARRTPLATSAPILPPIQEVPEAATPEASKILIERAIKEAHDD